MKRSNRLVFLMIFVMLLLGACDKSGVSREEFAAGNLNSESLLAEAEDLDVLNSLLGGINAKQLFDFLGTSLDTLDTLAEEGYTSKEDYNTLRNIIVNIYEALKAEKAEYEANPEMVGSEDTAVGEASQAMGELMRLAAENQVGTLLYQVLSRINHEGLLTADLYPMLDYVMAIDRAILKDLGGGIGIGNLTEDQKKRITFLFNDARTGSLNAQFNTLKEKLAACKGESSSSEIDLRTTLENLAGDRTVGDLKALLDPDQAVGNPTVALLLAALDELLEMASDSKKGGFQDDVKDLLAAGGHTLAKPNSNKLLSDIYGAVAPNYLDANKREVFHAFALNAVGGVAPTTDDATIDGLAKALASVDPANALGIAKGANYLFTQNMYGKACGQAGTDLYGTNMAVKQSWFRSLCFLMAAADYVPKLGTIEILPIMASSDEVDGKVVDEPNLSVWTVGEIVTALQAAKAYNAGSYPASICIKKASIMTADINDDKRVSIFEAFDWVMYRKNYAIALGSLELKKFSGLVGMMSDTLPLMAGPILPHAVFDSFASLVYLGGGDIDFPNHATVGYGTAGKNHKLFAVFAPLMEYFWEQKRVPEMVGMLSGLNEIIPDVPPVLPTDHGYGPIVLGVKYGDYGKEEVFGDDQVGTVFKSFEPLLAKLTNPDLVAPALDIAFTTLNKLNTATYQDNDDILSTLLSTLKLGDGLSKKTDAQLIKLVGDAFAANGPIDSLCSTLGNDDKRGKLAEVGEAAGAIMITLADANHGPLQPEDHYLAMRTLMDLGSSFKFDISWGAYDELVNYLLEDINGVPNPLVSKSRKFGYRLLDVKDANYNPEGAITDEWTLVAALDHLLVWPVKGENGRWTHADGETGLYSPEYILNFKQDLDVNPELLKTVAEDGAAMLDKIMGDEHLSFSFLQAMFTEVDINGDGSLDDSVVLLTLRLIHPEALNSADTMNELLVEIGDLVSGVELSANSQAFDQILKLMEFLVQSTTVK